MQYIWGIIGIIGILAIALALSTARKSINLRTVLGALAIQLIFGFTVLKWEVRKRDFAIQCRGSSKK